MRFDSREHASVEIFAGELEVVVHLKIEPEFGTVAEVERKPHCRISRNTPPILDNFDDPVE